MPTKDVTVQAEMGAGMTIQCTADNHSFFIDQPKSAGGQDMGPTPLEYYLASIAGCIGSIGRIVAMQKKITMRRMTITTTGTINTDVLLGRNTTERAGFQSIRLAVELDADLTSEQKLEFLHEVERRCPVSENTSNPSQVQLTLVE